MNEDLFAFIVERYALFNKLLDDFSAACDMAPSDERKELVQSIKERTNHTGLHYTALELTQMFLGETIAHVE